MVTRVYGHALADKQAMEESRRSLEEAASGCAKLRGSGPGGNGTAFLDRGHRCAGGEQQQLGVAM